MPDNRASIATLLAEIDEMTPGGFAIGLHVVFTGPAFLFQTFPQPWTEHYANRGLHLADPAVAWSLAHTGHVHWSALAADDPAGVIAAARAHGLRYGTTMAIFERDSRSVLGCARPDRDYLDAELDDIRARLSALHRLTLGRATLPPALEAALRKMSIRLSHG